MNQELPAMNSKTKSPRRFTRITTAVDSGRVTSMIWRSPEFSVGEIDKSTVFVHRLPFLIPEKIRRKQIGTYTMLFSSQQVDMADELEKAYPNTKYRGIPVGRLIDRALRSVLNKAMAEIFMKAKNSNDPYAKYMKGDRKVFAKAARPQRLPQKKRMEKRAIRLARQYETLSPTIVKIRRSIQEFSSKPENGGNEEKLIEDLKRWFSEPWIPLVVSGVALQNLPEIPGYGKNAETLIGLDWTARQLTVGIIKCIEDKRKEQPSLNANTIMEDYLPLGRKLLKERRSGKTI
jgi:hypothetical protein